MRAGVVVAAEPDIESGPDGRTGRPPRGCAARTPPTSGGSARRHRSPRERLPPDRGAGRLGSERAERVAARPGDRERRGGAGCRAVVPRPPDQAAGTSRRRAAARLGRRRLDARAPRRSTWGTYASDRELLDIPLDAADRGAAEPRRDLPRLHPRAARRVLCAAGPGGRGQARRRSGRARCGSAPTSEAIGSRRTFSCCRMASTTDASSRPARSTSSPPRSAPRSWSSSCAAGRSSARRCRPRSTSRGSPHGSVAIDDLDPLGRHTTPAGDVCVDLPSGQAADRHRSPHRW